MATASELAKIDDEIKSLDNKLSGESWNSTEDLNQVDESIENLHGTLNSIQGGKEQVETTSKSSDDSCVSVKDFNKNGKRSIATTKPSTTISIARVNTEEP